jgi:hypothetical protein
VWRVGIPTAVDRLRRGRNVKRLVEEELRPLLSGWANLFRIEEVKGIFEQLDRWI